MKLTACHVYVLANKLTFLPACMCGLVIFGQLEKQGAGNGTGTRSGNGNLQKKAAQAETRHAIACTDVVHKHLLG